MKEVDFVYLSVQKPNEMKSRLIYILKVFGIAIASFTIMIGIIYFGAPFAFQFALLYPLVLVISTIFIKGRNYIRYGLALGILFYLLTLLWILGQVGGL